VGTAALGCLAGQGPAGVWLQGKKNRRASLDWTAEGGCLTRLVSAEDPRQQRKTRRASTPSACGSSLLGLYCGFFFVTGFFAPGFFISDSRPPIKVKASVALNGN